MQTIRALAQEAFIYGYPMVDLYSILYNYAGNPASTENPLAGGDAGRKPAGQHGETLDGRISFVSDSWFSWYFCCRHHTLH